jgi:hypothetical protein
MLRPRHDGAYWANVTKQFDFSGEDRLDSAAYNKILWTGTMGEAAYPDLRSGANLRRGADGRRSR